MSVENECSSFDIRERMKRDNSISSARMVRCVLVQSSSSSSSSSSQKERVFYFFNFF